MEVKLRDLDRNSDDSKVFNDMKGPSLSVALSPNADYLACSSGDGKLRIWNTKTSQLVHEIACVPKANSFFTAKQLCRVDFEPICGKHLAYPLENAIVLLNTFDWSEICQLKSDEIEAPITTLQYSPCGEYIAAATSKGEFVIWELDSKQFKISKHEQNIGICALMWNPKGKQWKFNTLTRF